MLKIAARKGYDAHHAGTLGKEISSNQHLIHAVYDFAVQGGAISTLNLSDIYGDLIRLPKGAWLTDSWIVAETAATSGGTPAVDIGLNGSNQIANAVDVTSAYSTTPAAGAVVVATKTGYKQVTADDSLLTFKIATAALTAGKLHIYVAVAFSE